MGMLEFDGEPLKWNEIKPYVNYVKKHGIIQFLHNYERLMKRPEDILKWGDEVEYMILRFDHENRKVQLSLRGEDISKVLQEKENSGATNLTSLWRQEYASYMVEGTPGVPYFGNMAQFNVVEANMKLRRKEVQQLLQPDEQIMSLTVFPRLGCFDFTNPTYRIEGPETNPVSRSLFFPDQAISSHPRFPFLTQNIRERRGEKIAINIPIFKDTNTPSPFIEKFNDPEAQRAAKPDHIYMDCMGFGMGNSCLQLTFQACNVDEAKLLYDQLAPICPIMMALSAAAPIYRGYIADIDVRWQVIAQSVDDRTLEERGLEPLKNNERVIRKSRYDSIDSYLEKKSKIFNDIDLEIDEETENTLLEAGIDELLAKHIAHLWIRDPLTLFSKKIELDDEKVSDHFENIQSTNWQSMRFKPPPPGSKIGWRVEFRVCEAQLTDFENAAFVVFVVLLTRVILTYKLDFLMPLSCVDKNMDRAQKNNAVLKEKFYFRRNVITSNTPACCTQLCSSTNDSINCTDDISNGLLTACCEEMSIDTIINGKEDVFPGFISLIRKYLDSVEVGVEARCSIREYLDLISKRASGDYMTAAQWMRHFVTSHPEYKQDSVVSDSIAYDLLVRCDQIEKGEVTCHQLFGMTKHKSEYIAANSDTARS
ncbi:glutamate--cysteine ligase catalytic subunit-like [Clavelina lepadiformis]|uniref:Glutamate--cysteine ligase n=1 Tax=Clavelina lepadiformis TaxID=159417 RepID=A0ABP0H053_CLALP